MDVRHTPGQPPHRSGLLPGLYTDAILATSLAPALQVTSAYTPACSGNRMRNVSENPSAAFPQSAPSKFLRPFCCTKFQTHPCNSALRAFCRCRPSPPGHTQSHYLLHDAWLSNLGDIFRGDCSGMLALTVTSSPPCSAILQFRCRSRDAVPIASALRLQRKLQVRPVKSTFFAEANEHDPFTVLGRK